MTYDNAHNSMRDYLHYDFSSGVMKVTESQIESAKKEREKLQKAHEGALPINLWEDYE